MTRDNGAEQSRDGTVGVMDGKSESEPNEVTTIVTKLTD